ncbi:hypothetical protein V6767_20290 [Martelella sp. FLE1502]
MSDENDFMASEKSQAAFPVLSKQVSEAAFRIAEDFAEYGQSVREATSLTAEIFVNAAWLVAASGAIAEGNVPQGDLFRKAAENAINRIDIDKVRESINASEAQS